MLIDPLVDCRFSVFLIDLRMLFYELYIIYGTIISSIFHSNSSPLVLVMFHCFSVALSEMTKHIFTEDSPHGLDILSLYAKLLKTF